MADYYPLLSRALEALPDRSPALRKAVYDRARNALVGQLRSLDPPIPESDIDLERDALDAAIARLEASFGVNPPAKAAEPPSPEPAPVSPLPPPRPEPAEAEPETPPEPVLPPAPPFEAAAAPETLPEPGPPADFVPFVPPPRKPKPEESPPAEPASAEEAPASETEPPPNGTSAADTANERRRPRIDVVAPRAGRSRLLRNLFVGAVLVAVIGTIAVAAYMLRDRPSDLPQSSEQEQEAPADTSDAKFADRVGGDRPEAGRRPPPAPPSTMPQSDVTVAQSATLYEENTSDQKAPPIASKGHVVWRLEPVNGEQGQPLQNAVRANVEFPDAGLTLAVTIRKNLDATLPASHTIELAFTNDAKGEKRTVQDIGLLQLKDEENARGSPVSGLPVRVSDNLFLIGLSNLPNDIERNTDLLTRRNWLELAVKYKAGPRAILIFEKGTAGAQVIQSAVEQWQE